MPEDPASGRLSPPAVDAWPDPSYACPPALVWACVIGDDLFYRVQHHVRSIQEWEHRRAGRVDA